MKIKKNCFNRHDGIRKSTIGALLSKKMNMKFIDVDSKIETIENKQLAKFLNLRVKNILEL